MSGGVPSWVRDLRPLLALTGVVGTLEAIGEDPTGFILERVLGTFVGWILDGTTFLVGQINQAFAPLIGAPAAAGEPLLGAGGVVVGSISSVIMTVNDALVSVAGAAGPAAPFVIALTWAALAVASAAAIRYVLTVVQWI